MCPQISVHVLLHLSFTMTLQGGCHYIYFTDHKTETNKINNLAPSYMDINNRTQVKIWICLLTSVWLFKNTKASFQHRKRIEAMHMVITIFLSVVYEVILETEIKTTESVILGKTCDPVSLLPTQQCIIVCVVLFKYTA